MIHLSGVDHSYYQRIQYSFSEYLSKSTKNLKMAIITTLALVLLAPLAYVVLRQRWKEKTVDQKKISLDEGKKVNDVASQIFKQVEVPKLNYKGILKDLAEKIKPFFKPEDFLPSADMGWLDSIQCPKRTRVETKNDKVDGVDVDKSNMFYLHANHVQLEGHSFIASQYPLNNEEGFIAGPGKKLVNQIPSFWLACEKASLIIDLSNQADKVKSPLVAYTPEPHKSKDYGDLRVTCEKEEFHDGLKVNLSHYRVESKAGAATTEKNDVIHFNIPRLEYNLWNDLEGISEDQLDELLKIIDQYQTNPDSPVVIHCRIGVGRTGTLIAAYALKCLIEKNVVTKDNLQNHLCGVILKGREQRGPLFVQSDKQIETLWNWAYRALVRHLESQKN